jgi:hypothetical protein
MRSEPCLEVVLLEACYVGEAHAAAKGGSQLVACMCCSSPVATYLLPHVRRVTMHIMI